MQQSSAMPMERAAGSTELRRVMISGALGQFVEWYDFVVYAYSATVITRLFFPTIDPAAGLLSTLAVYALGFVTRPLGAVLWGVLGDRFGRRGILSAIILLMGGATAAIGLLPVYAQIGILAPTLLVVCRLLQGLSAAGESVGASSFVAEHAPPERRGLYVGIVYSSAVLPPIAAALLVLLLTSTLSAEAYGSWGWRLPFLLGAPLALVGIYIRNRTEESPAFRQTQASRRVARTPLRTALRDYRGPMGNAFALAALSSLGFYTMAGYFVTYLTATVGIPQSTALVSNSIALAVVFVSMVTGAAISDRLGRRRVMLGGVIASAVLCIPAYMVAAGGGFGNAVLGQCLLAVPLGFFFGPSGVAILEFFPTRIRLSGALLSYNVAYAIFGGSAQLLSAWLILATGNKLAPAFYMLGLAAIVVVVLLRLPETSSQTLVHQEDTVS